MFKRIKIVSLIIASMMSVGTHPAYASQDFAEIGITNIQPKQATIFAVGADYTLRKSAICLAELFARAQKTKIAFISDPVIGPAEAELFQDRTMREYFQSLPDDVRRSHRSLTITVYLVDEVTSINYEVSNENSAEYKRCSL